MPKITLDLSDDDILFLKGIANQKKHAAIQDGLSEGRLGNAGMAVRSYNEADQWRRIESAIDKAGW